MKTEQIKILFITIFLCACNDGGSLPRAQFHQKSADATALTEQEYLEQKISYGEANKDSYFQRVIDAYLKSNQNNEAEDEISNSVVAINFSGKNTPGPGIQKELQDFCTVTLGRRASSLSEDSQKIILESLNVSEIGAEFVNANTLEATSKDTFMIYVGSNSVSSGCSGDLYAGLALVDHGDVFSGESAVIFDPPSESSEVLTKLVHHITNAYHASVGKTDLLTEYSGFSGSLDKLNIDFSTTQTLEGISRGVAGLNAADVADFSSVATQIEALVTARALPLANLDKALTVIALAATVEGNQNSNKFDVNKAIQTLGTAANSPAADAVSTIALAAGHPEVALGLEVIKALLGNNAAQQEQNQQEMLSLPKLDEMFNLQSFAETSKERAEFFVGYREFNKYLEQRYSGETLSALKSLSLIAFAQSYKKE